MHYALHCARIRINPIISKKKIIIQQAYIESQPVKYEAKHELKALFVNSGEANVEIMYQKSSYTRNEDVEFLCKVDNRGSKKDLSSIKLVFMRRLVAKTKDRKNSGFYTYSKKLHEETINGCKAGQIFE